MIIHLASEYCQITIQLLGVRLKYYIYFLLLSTILTIKFIINTIYNQIYQIYERSFISSYCLMILNLPLIKL